MGGICDPVCFEEKKKTIPGVPRLSLSLSLSFQAEAEENSQGDTSVEEADNWSKAGERFAPLNPAARLSEGATSPSGCFEGVSRTVTTIVSFCCTHLRSI